jgi:hypothetical protein
MQKITITFNNIMVDGEVINLLANAGQVSMRGTSTYTGVANTFEIGASASESAANYASAITIYNSIYNIFGPVVIETTGSDVEITFISTSVTSSSVEYIGASSVLSTATSTVSEDIYDYDKQIFTRSPHFYDVESTNGLDIDSAELHVFIYMGSRYSDRPAAPTYVVRSSATLSDTNKLTFNISELAKSFASVAPSGSGSLVNFIPYVDIFPFYTQDGLSYSLPPSLGIAYNGYGYFEEGYNPQSQTALAQSNNLIITRDDYGFSVPVFSDKAERVIFELEGETVRVENILSPSTFSTMPITSVGSGTQSPDVPVALQGSLLEEQDYYNNDAVNDFYHSVRNHAADTVYIENKDGNIETVKVRYIEECKYDPIRLIFINKFGSFQDIFFYKSSSVSLKTKEDSFRRNIISLSEPLGGVNDGYNTTAHQNKNLYKSGKQSISLNSGFYPEEYNEVFKQLMLSEDVWIKYEERILPVNISDSSMDFKTRLNEKLIEYSIKCDFAFDTINSAS